MMSLLEITDLRVSYGAIKAVQGVDISVGTGEIATLVGANGAGKSSVLNAITGIVPAAGGKIVFDGTDITDWPTDRIVAAGITQSMEGRQVFPGMSVLENLTLGGYTRTKQQVKDGIEHAYFLFPVLKERAHQSAGTLSGGEQQMLAVARALMCSPRLLMLDEPSLGLAPIIVRDMFEHIERINRETGTAILLVEQNARIALSISQRGFVIERGHVRLSGTAQELLASDEVISAYLGG